MLPLAVLPFFFFLLLFGTVYAIIPYKTGTEKLRLSFLYTALLTSLLVVILTELLSSMRMLTFSGILSAWCICIITLIAYFFYRRLQFSFVKDIFFYYGFFKKEWVAWVIVFILTVSLVIGVAYPPNNIDSMTYHLARIAHWQQNGSVSFYPTHVLRQLDMPPFAEYAVLHFNTLSGSDRFANLVQLFFFIGCILVVSLITKELGGNPTQQKLSSLFAAFIPIAILQSSTTQNDIVVAFFISCFVYFTLVLFKKVDFKTVSFAGIALGLALLTKGVTYIYALPFCAWYLMLLAKEFKKPLSQIFRTAGLMIFVPLIALTINSTFMYRNIQLTGSALGISGETTRNEGIEPKQILLVAIKNVLNHFPANKNIKNEVRSIAQKWHIDVNDKRYNFASLDRMAEAIDYHEDYAQNFGHVILIFACSLLFLFRKRFYKEKISVATLFFFTLLMIALLFCILVKWQPWANRLEVPLFMLFCVFMGMQIGKHNKIVQLMVVVFLSYFGFRALFYNSRRPLRWLEQSVFARKTYEDFRGFDKGFWESRDFINTTPYTKIGLVMGPDSWDYPYYKLLSTKERKRELEHVLVTNPSRKYAGLFIPDAILSDELDKLSYTFNGNTYYRTSVFEHGPALFEKQKAQ